VRSRQVFRQNKAEGIGERDLDRRERRSMAEYLG